MRDDLCADERPMLYFYPTQLEINGLRSLGVPVKWGDIAFIPSPCCYGHFLSTLHIEGQEEDDFL